jgi:Concanavalin A-like lectin/glucanases superfamily
MRKFYSLLTFRRALKPCTLLALMLSLYASPLYAQDPSVNLDYDGTNDFVTLPDDIVMGLNGDFTIEAWVNWRGASATFPDPTFMRIFDFGNDLSNYMFLVPQSNFNGQTGVMFAITIAGVTQYVQSATPLPTNSWHHIAVTIDNASNTATLFIDGTPIVPTAGSTAPGSFTFRPGSLGSTTNNWLGRSEYAVSPFNDPFYNGNIDELRISNTVRYTGVFTPHPTEFVNDANTIALYHFDEGVGQTTADASGHFTDAVLGDFNTVESTDPTWVTGSILPVTLIQFDAQKTGGSITLNWKASVTGDGGQFLVEHSTNGQTFQGIGTLPISNVSGTYSFAFTDASPKPGKNFYRLKIAENNATPKYSPILLVELPAKSLYAAYPSITNTTLFVKIPKATTLMIYNELGLLVKRIKLQNSQDIQVNDLSKGNYLIRFEGAGDTVRFTKL